MKTKISIVAVLFAALSLIPYPFSLPSFAQGGTWTQKTSLPAPARCLAVGFSIGDKGYLGTGGDASGSPLYKDFWQYNPLADAWTQKTDFANGTNVRYDAMGFAVGDKGYIGTGTDANDNNDLWEYDTTANQWTQKANVGNILRFGAVGFSIGNKGYMGTGMYINMQSFAFITTNDFWEYDPAASAWTQKAPLPSFTRRDAVGFSIGNKGYIAAGTNWNFTAKYKDCWEYDPTGNSWTKKADLGGLARYAAVEFSIGMRGYVGMGAAGGGALNDWWEFDPIADTWTPQTNFPGTARKWASGFAIQSAGKGYIGTGETNTTNANDLWEFTPDSVISVPISVNELMQQDISIYPNPSNGKFQIQVNSKQLSIDKWEVIIYNALGEKVFEDTALKGVKQIDVLLPSETGQGIYFLNIRTDNENIIKKLIISK